MPSVSWIVALLVLVGAASVSWAEPPPPPTSRLTALADAHVVGNSPSASFGSAPTLETGGAQAPGGARRAFVKFALPKGLTLLSATLRARLVSAPPQVENARLYHRVHLVADDSWTEESLTWNTQPAVTGAAAWLGHADLPDLGDAIWDVTELAQQEQAGDGILSLRLALHDETSATAGDHLYEWSSREGGVGFRLDVVYAELSMPVSDDLLLFGRDTQDRHSMRVIGVDPDSSWAWLLASFTMIEAFDKLAVDPTDGSVVALVPRLDPWREPSLVRVDLASGVVTELVADWFGAGWGPPDGFDVAADGSIYSIRYPVESAPARVLRLERDGSGPQVVSEGGLLAEPSALTLTPDGDLLVYDDASGLLQIDPVTGGQTLLVESPVSSVHAMTVAGSGTLWIVGPSEVDDFLSSELVGIDLATGQIVRPEIEVPMFSNCIAEEASGTLLIADCAIIRGPHATGLPLVRLDPETGAVETLSDWDDLVQLADLATAPDGTVLATQYQNGAARVVRIGADKIETIFAPLGTATNRLVLDEQRQILLADGDRVVRLDPFAGTQQVLASFPSDTVPDPWVQAVALSPTGRLFALTSNPLFAASLVEIDRKTGAQELIFDWLSASSTALAVEATGSWLVGASAGPFGPPIGDVVRIDPDGTDELLSSGGLLTSVDQIALARDGAVVVLDRRAGRVVRVDATTGEQELLGLAPDGMAHLTLDRADRPLVAGQDRVIRLEPDGSETLLTSADNLWYRFQLDLELLPGIALLRPGCDDGLDNDGDGAIDWPHDGHCSSPEDSVEARGCGLGAELAPLLVLLARRRRMRDRRSESGRAIDGPGTTAQRDSLPSSLPISP